MTASRYPMIDDLVDAARRRMPRFAFDYLDCGAGREIALERNRQAFDAIQLTPRYMRDLSVVDLSTELLGQRHELPFGIAPIGLSGLIWPGSERVLAATANKAGIPFALSTVATCSLEEVAQLAGERAWFQLYAPRNDEMRNDLLRRVHEHGYGVLLLTVDVPGPARRERTIRSGLTVPPRITPGNLWQGICCPAWSLATLRTGLPQFENLTPYAPARDLRNISQFIGKELSRQLLDTDLREIRELWPGKLIVKGILHPDDAERAMDGGADALVISNHGGRQSDALPSPLTVLREIRSAVGDEVPLLLDSGARSGLDIVRALASGADFVLLGRAFYYGICALGRHGGDHVVSVLRDELLQTMRQIGCTQIAEVDESFLSEGPRG